jgi:uncharacterized membrane protein
MASKILSKIAQLDKKLNKLSEIEEQLNKVVEQEKEEIKAVKEEESRLETDVLKLTYFTVKKKHIMELTRGVAGAFLGVGLGQALGGSVAIAQNLPWINTLGILVFILVIVSVLIYRTDKDQIKGTHWDTVSYVTKQLVFLYTISLLVQLCGLFLFDSFPGWNGTLVKALIVGSYAAMSSAAAFTLI